MAFSTQLFGGFLFISLITQVIAHSYVTSPITRSNQFERQTGCRGPNCLGPCDAPLSSIRRAPISAMRGEPITVKWPRNNHAGGFIRFAWSPTSQSDSHESFDAHVQQINCHEVGGCHPDDSRSPNGGDSGPADGSSRACTTNITIPLDLTDGQWTLQWSWFGGAFALGDYYSCVDYKISGGAVGKLNPVFIGGDYSYPGSDKCKFFNTDKLHVCVNEPCQNSIYPNSVQQFGSPAVGQLGLINIETPTLPETIPETVPESTPETVPESIPETVTVGTSSTSSEVVDMSSSTSSSESDESSASIDVSSSTSSSTGDNMEDSDMSSSSSGSTPTSENTMSSSSNVANPTEISGVIDLSSSSSSTSSGSSSGDIVMESSSTSSSSSSSSSSSTSSSGSDVPQDSSSSSSSSSSTTSYSASNGCTLGHMVCAGEGQYQTCTNGREGNYWSNVQKCQPGLSCHPSGDFIYCY